MTVLATGNTINYTGNIISASAIEVGADNLGTAAASKVTFTAGSGAPTATATKGSLYSRIDGSSVSTRLYVNTDGGTTWTSVTTAA